MSKAEKYRRIGIKLTPQRLAILNYLEGNKDHPSVDDIHKAVSLTFPTMSLATVYSTLDTLAQHGKVRALYIDANKKRFDPNTKIHHHLICTACRKILDLHTEFQLEVPKEDGGDFEISGNHVEFYGICSQCRTAK